MATKWYCRIGTQEAGPFSPQDVIAMALDGRIRPSDLIRKGIDGSWIPASDVQGLNFVGLQGAIPNPNAAQPASAFPPPPPPPNQPMHVGQPANVPATSKPMWPLVVGGVVACSIFCCCPLMLLIGALSGNGGDVGDDNQVQTETGLGPGSPSNSNVSAVGVWQQVSKAKAVNAGCPDHSNFIEPTAPSLMFDLLGGESVVLGVTGDRMAIQTMRGAWTFQRNEFVATENTSRMTSPGDWRYADLAAEFPKSGELSGWEALSNDFFGLRAADYMCACGLSPDGQFAVFVFLPSGDTIDEITQALKKFGPDPSGNGKSMIEIPVVIWCQRAGSEQQAREMGRAVSDAQLRMPRKPVELPAISPSTQGKATVDQTLTPSQNRSKPVTITLPEFAPRIGGDTGGGEIILNPGSAANSKK